MFNVDWWTLLLSAQYMSASFIYCVLDSYVKTPVFKEATYHLNISGRSKLTFSYYEFLHIHAANNHIWDSCHSIMSKSFERKFNWFDNLNLIATHLLYKLLFFTNTKQKSGHKAETGYYLVS